MKRSGGHGRRAAQDSGQSAPQQPEKSGWIRKFCGRGIFRELWRNRYVILRGEHLYISDKEVRDERKAQEVFDLADYERSEELRKPKSRSKKNHSRFTLLRCRQQGNTNPNLVFLAVSPEDKESWIHALNAALLRAKNRVLDQVTIEDNALVHPTRDRAKIPHGRRLPSRGHLLSVASTSSHGMLTLDLVAEEDYEVDSWRKLGAEPQGAGPQGAWQVGGRQRAGTDVSKLRASSKEPRVKTGSLPRGSGQVQVLQAQSRTPQPGKRISAEGRSRCASMDEVRFSRPVRIRSELRSALRRCTTEEEAGGGACVPPGGGACEAPGGGACVAPVGQLQSLIAQRMQRAQELLEEMRLQELQKVRAERGGGGGSLKSVDSPRLHHLRSPDSPHSKSGPGSPRSRSGSSPRLRGKESPRSRTKRSRCRDSPGSRGSGSPAAKQPETPPPTATARHSNPRDPAPESPPLESGCDGGGTPSVEDPEAPPPRAASQAPPPEGSQSSPGAASGDKSASPAGPAPCWPVEAERWRAEAELLLQEAVSSWREAQEVLQEVKELQSHTLRRQRRQTYQTATSSGEGAEPAAGPATPPPTAEDGEESEAP